VTFLVCLAPALFSQTVLKDNRGFATVQEILARSCAACHEWTGSRETIIADGRVIAGDPDKSILWQRIADDSMPQSGDKLSADEKSFLRGWIAAGAPETTDTVSGATPPADAGTGPGKNLPSASFLLFPSKAAFHEATGFASTALFLAAGVIGVVRYLDMKDAAHPNGSEGDTEGGGEEDYGAMRTIWASNQTLRWWHVGLVAAGETLYLGDAITGISMLTKQTPGKIGKKDIHRYAFFTHATLMAAQIVLGFLETDALSRGAHDESIFYTGAHAVIGVVIPGIMLYAGLEEVLP
jgi:hypothetical protein